MKSFKIVTLTLFSCFVLTNVYAQQSEREKVKAKEKELDTLPYNPLPLKKKLLSPYTFNRFLADTYGFTILGSQTPVTGLKFETVKPSITLSGNLVNSKNKTFILNLEISGGVVEDVADIFSSNKLNGYVKASLGFNFLTKYNSATFPGKTDKSPATAEMGNRLSDFALLDSLKRINYYTRIAAIHKALNDQRFFDSPNLATFSKIYAETKKTDLANYNLTQEKVLLLKVLASYGITQPDVNLALKSFVDRWKNLGKKDPVNNTPLSDTITTSYGMLFQKNYRDALKTIELAKDSLSDTEMRMFKDIYNTVSLKWINISPIVGNTAFHLYDASLGSISSRHSLTLDLKMSFNYLFKYQKNPGRFIFVSGGITPKRTNSLADIDKFSYKTSEQIIKIGNETITDETTGVAYRGNYLNGFGLDVFLEAYFCLAKSKFVPGLYTKISYAYGEPWVNDHQFPAELGIIYNLPSSDKDSKNLLSIIPYVSWTNLNKSVHYATRTNESLHSKFAVGLKVGVPINIGK
ncbi:hypothetical protein [Pedobacter boryungensis]|uniref:Porin n=1 Tax=Pedobacter boryungensis TaxID=869962 RepID=A0ABX2DE80_9SPHI|nr:hypothetical protein [Pedobacter boryungensis]NQX32122.1 hypothetical protein [Pedobacter boryungensis]